MDTKEKLEWIDALKKTIESYTIAINGGFVRHRGFKNCQLCQLAVKKDNDQYCKHCIHLDKEFGQGIECLYQKSFEKIYELAEQNNDIDGALMQQKYRRKYLMCIAKNLKLSIK